MIIRGFTDAFQLRFMGGGGGGAPGLVSYYLRIYISGNWY